MKPVFGIAALAVLLIAPSPCFAEWLIAEVSKEQAKEMGMEVRSERAGPKDVRVELEFKTEGELKNFSRVELHIGERHNPLVTAPLREDRSKSRRIRVSFTADRARLDQLSLCVRVPGTLGGIIYDLRIKDFVEAKKDR